jgi:hypothetical protein
MPATRATSALRTLRLLGTRAIDGSEVSWHPAGLTSRVAECFDTVQSAWTQRDAEALRPYVSDAMYERVDAAFDDFEDVVQVNRVADLKLEGMALGRIDFGAADGHDRLVVDIAFRARDWLEDLRTGAVLQGNREGLTRFVQQWTLIRDPEVGWVVDAVGPRSTDTPSMGSVVQPGGDGRPVGAGAPADSTTSLDPSVLRVGLVVLICIVAVAVSARVGLGLGSASVPTRNDALRARVDAERAAFTRAERVALERAKTRGYTAGLARGRNAGRARGRRLGTRAGRAKGEEQAAIAAAALRSSRSTAASGTSATSAGGATSTGTTSAGTGTTPSAR